ncbi:MAG: DDE-type integrase/transposase/recombinase [Candidatus Methanofishera endochildressiae]|uniref:DDE-type integrase/transposase/recombinase n=1 Tax=Candidatus Methanofishera endochildressiae TaxID=2738884 RepID=A0A7Z0MQ11_9GAMM|nr:DDE-type integrase/transposase/recombinase [Candidatus Methanofishera endochildressiae]
MVICERHYVSEHCKCLFGEKPAPGILHHSGRGSQYASYEYRQHLDIMQMQQSMSRKGNCWDNAPTERFFRSLKHEELNYENFRTKGGVAIFAKACFGHPSPSKRQKLNATAMPSAPRFVLVTTSRPNRGSEHWLQMT